MVKAEEHKPSTWQNLFDWANLVRAWRSPKQVEQDNKPQDTGKVDDFRDLGGVGVEPR